MTTPDLAAQTYLTTAEAATYLRYRSVKTFESYAKRVGLVPCRDGRRRLWLRVDLDNRHQGNRRAVLRSRGALRSAS